MNRRGFIQTLSAAVATFAILPSATTYGRKWVKRESGIYDLNPDYFNAQYEINFLLRADSLETALQPIIYDRFLAEPAPWPYESGNIIREPYPLRFHSREDVWSQKNIPVMIQRKRI